MKLLSLTVLLASLTSCATGLGPVSHTGPKAKIMFSSPHLERDVTGAGVSLHVMDSNADCSFDHLGGIKLRFGKTSETTEVPADERTLFRVEQHRNGSTEHQDFAFVPEQGARYVIEQQQPIEDLHIKYYVIDEVDGRKEIKVDGLELCR